MLIFPDLPVPSEAPPHAGRLFCTNNNTLQLDIGRRCCTFATPLYTSRMYFRLTSLCIAWNRAVCLPRWRGEIRSLHHCVGTSIALSLLYSAREFNVIPFHPPALPCTLTHLPAPLDAWRDENKDTKTLNSVERAHETHVYVHVSYTAVEPSSSFVACTLSILYSCCSVESLTWQHWRFIYMF